MIVKFLTCGVLCLAPNLIASTAMWYVLFFLAPSLMTCFDAGVMIGQARGAEGAEMLPPPAPEPAAQVVGDQTAATTTAPAQTVHGQTVEIPITVTPRATVKPYADVEIHQPESGCVQSPSGTSSMPPGRSVAGCPGGCHGSGVYSHGHGGSMGHDIHINRGPSFLQKIRLACLAKRLSRVSGRASHVSGRASHVSGRASHRSETISIRRHGGCCR